MTSVLACRENVDHFLWRIGTAECSTRLLMSAKMAELTPMASARVNTRYRNAGGLEKLPQGKFEILDRKVVFPRCMVVTGLIQES